MADKIILLDTSILIDYYRKTDKENTVWIKLIDEGYAFGVSVITKFEIFSGATSAQVDFWDSILKAITIFPFNETCVDTAVQLQQALKRKRKQLDFADLFIAATALTFEPPIATLNKKHFERVDNLSLIL